MYWCVLEWDYDNAYLHRIQIIKKLRRIPQLRNEQSAKS
nr:MAG TPA_asm: hypothetical protein [Bacteriophage sp.]